MAKLRGVVATTAAVVALLAVPSPAHAGHCRHIGPAEFCGTVNNVYTSDRSIYVSCNRDSNNDPTGPYFYVQPGTSSSGDCSASNGDTDLYHVPNCDFKVFKAMWIAGTWIATGSRISSGWHVVHDDDDFYFITIESHC
jgi:hypothetical protein